MTRSDHLFLIEGNNLIHCKNCNQKFNLQLPQPVDFVADVVKAFGRVHKKCKPQQKVEK